MLRILKYFSRDKVDLAWFIVYILFIVLYFVQKDEVVLLASSFWGLVWGTGAIIRMGIFTDKIKEQ